MILETLAEVPASEVNQVGCRLRAHVHKGAHRADLTLSLPPHSHLLQHISPPPCIQPRRGWEDLLSHWSASLQGFALGSPAASGMSERPFFTSIYS